jgi:hypothetical protein
MRWNVTLLMHGASPPELANFSWIKEAFVNAVLSIRCQIDTAADDI